MPSIPARMINNYLSMKMKPLPLADMDPTKIREVFEKAPAPFLPSDVRTISIDERGPAGAVKGEWHLAPAIDPSRQHDRTILYIHGGGYVFGSPRTHRSLTFALTRRTDAPVFSLDYRLAPEHQCPAAIDDAEAAFEWLIAGGRSPSQIVVGGDSAGGGLALALLHRLRDRGAKTPAGAFLYSPWTDLTASGASYEENEATDYMFQTAHVRRGAGRYAGSLAGNDPRVSPLFGSMDRLPPLLVFASASELLRDDSVRLVEKARRAGVKVDFVLREGLVHVWPVFSPIMPEANDAVARTVEFIREPGSTNAD
ncbi:MAG: alpha/beta hydrolase fold domain-containing protein [Alphaproteobacteria bacterium]|nr:alpha/beta hydrolase fold domain-containing protein [Alphaproteobacteria bacterium]